MACADTKYLPYFAKDETAWYFIQFATEAFCRCITFRIIDIAGCESLRNEQGFKKFPCQLKSSSIFAISFRINGLLDI